MSSHTDVSGSAFGDIGDVDAKRKGVEPDLAAKKDCSSLERWSKSKAAVLLFHYAFATLTPRSSFPHLLLMTSAALFLD